MGLLLAGLVAWRCAPSRGAGARTFRSSNFPPRRCLFFLLPAPSHNCGLPGAHSPWPGASAGNVGTLVLFTRFLASAPLSCMDREVMP